MESDTIDRSAIAQRLVDVRNGRAYRDTARLLEERAGYKVSNVAVSDRERGANIPAEHILAVAIAFEVDPVWLLTGEGPRYWDREGELEQGQLAAAEWLRRMAGWLEAGTVLDQIRGVARIPEPRMVPPAKD